MSLEFTGELCVMKMKNDPKFQEDLTFQFKTDMRNLTNYDRGTRKFRKSALLMGCFDQICNVFELKKVQRSYV